MKSLISKSNYNIISGYDKPGAEAGHMRPAYIGKECSSKASRAWTTFVKGISFGFIRGNYYEEYGNKVLKGYFTQKASEAIPADKPLNARIARAWQKAQYDPVEAAAKNFVHAQELLKLYDKKTPTNHLGTDTLIKEAVDKLNSAYKKPPGDKTQWTQIQEEAVNRLDVLDKNKDRVKAAYDAFPDDDSKKEFLGLLKSASEQGKLKEFLDAYHIVLTFQRNPQEALKDLKKAASIDDLKSKLPSDSKDMVAIQEFYGGFIRLTKTQVLKRVKHEALRQALHQSEMTPEEMDVFLKTLEAREQELIRFSPLLKDKIVKEHRDFIAAGNLIDNNSAAAERSGAIANLLKSPERLRYLNQNKEKYNLFQPAVLDTFEQDFVRARTQERIQIVKQMANSLGTELRSLLVDPLNKMNGNDEKEMAYLAEMSEVIPQLQTYKDSFDEKLVAQLVIDRDREKKIVGQDSAKDIEDLSRMQSEKMVMDDFLKRIDQASSNPYSLVLKAHCEKMSDEQILEFLKLPEPEKLNLLRPHLNRIANYLNQPGFIDAVIRNQGNRSAEEVISALAKANPHPINKEITDAISGVQKLMNREVALKNVALLLLDLGSSHIQRGEINTKNALSQSFKVDIAQKKGENITPDQAREFAEYLVRETRDPHLFYEMGERPKRYYGELVAVGYELMEMGLTPKQAAQAIAKKAGPLSDLKKKTAIQITKSEKDALKASITEQAKNNFQVDLIATDIKDNPLRLIKVILVSLLKGLPYDDKEISILEGKLDHYAPLLTNWQNLLQRSFAENPEGAEQINSLADKAFVALGALKIGVPKDTLQRLVDDLIQSVLDMLGNDLKKGPADFVTFGINGLLDRFEPDLQKQEVQKGLIGLKLALPLIKGALKAAVFFAPVTKTALNKALPLFTKGTESYLRRQIENLNNSLSQEESQELDTLLLKRVPTDQEKQIIKMLDYRKAKFGVLTPEQKQEKRKLQQEQIDLLEALKDTRSALFPPVVNALVQIERNHPGLIDDLIAVVDAAIIQPKAPPFNNQDAYSRIHGQDATKELVGQLKLSPPLNIAFTQVYRDILSEEAGNILGKRTSETDPLYDQVKSRMGAQIREKVKEEIKGKSNEAIIEHNRNLRVSQVESVFNEIRAAHGEEIFGSAIKQARQQALYELSEVYCQSRTPKPAEAKDPLFPYVMQNLGPQLKDEMYKTYFRNERNQAFEGAVLNFGRALVKDLQKDTAIIDSLLEGLVDNYSALPSSAADAARS